MSGITAWSQSERNRQSSLRVEVRPHYVASGRFPIASDWQLVIINGLAVGVAFESRAAVRRHILDLRHGGGLRLLSLRRTRPR
jgi:hypothetical protein